MTRSDVGLRLEFDPSDLRTLRRALPADRSEAETHRLVTTYFDTPDRAIWRSGYSLRVHRHGRRCVQTVTKNGGPAAGPGAHDEWEQLISGDTALLNAACGPLLDAIGEGAAAGLAPVFVTEIERMTLQFAFESADIELSIERGEVRADDEREPIAEVALELRGGDLHALFDFARRLDGHVPIRLAVAPVSERGYALLDRAALGLAKAAPVRLDPDMPVAEALSTIVRECIRHYRLNESLLLQSGDGETLHQARVALRRLLTALALFRPLLRGDADARRIDVELRHLIATLGQARNFDVLIARLGKPTPSALVQARTRADEHALAELKSARPRILMLDLLEWLNAGPWLEAPENPERTHAPILAFAVKRLDRRRRRLKRLGRGLAEGGARRSHRVRIEAKKVRYAAEFFASLWPSQRARRRQAAWARDLERVQDHLGELNDSAIGKDILAALGLEVVGGRPYDVRALRNDACAALAKLIEAPRFWKP